MVTETDLHSLQSYMYELPPELIAQRPACPRDSSRLLVLDRASGSIGHGVFRDIGKYLKNSDVLAANNSRVMRARLRGRRVLENAAPGGKVEFLMLRQLGELSWEGAFHASAKHKPGVMFEIPASDGRGVRGTIVRGASGSASGTVEVRFDRDPVDAGAGEMPLPPYIVRPADDSDIAAYQTVYASVGASAAAPTAGFHFTPELLAALRARGIGWEEITLDVGLGTFRPVKSADIRNHVMHEERFRISASVALCINDAMEKGRRIVAVGTTSVRALESAYDRTAGCVSAGARCTDIFIRPGAHEFGVVGAMITNFHLPGSTLLMLLCAFAGRDMVMRAYKEAVAEHYRFYSYGDAMLVL